MNARNADGHTLVEVMVVVTVLAIFLAGVGMVSVRTQDAFEEGSRAAELDAGLHRALEIIVRELEDVDRSQLAPLPEAGMAVTSLDFAVIEGWLEASDEVDLSPPRRIEWEREPGEVDDGFDNDGDFLVDEGRVVWKENPDMPDERRRVLVKGVREWDQGETANFADDDLDGLIDERGLSFLIEEDVLSVQLSIEGVDEGGRVRTRSARTSIHVQDVDAAMGGM